MLELIFMWIPMFSIIFSDVTSIVSTSNWNVKQASPKLNKGKNYFALALIIMPMFKWD